MAGVTKEEISLAKELDLLTYFKLVESGNPYGYDTLTGQRSNNMQHGVTWSYANGIYNDTAEIISMAAVYYQQDWPSSTRRLRLYGRRCHYQYCRA